MIENKIRAALQLQLEGYGLFENEVEIVLEKPARREHGDLSTNVALVLAKRLGRKPRELAGEMAAQVRLGRDLVESVEVAGPGFVNFRLARSFQVQRLLGIWREEGELAVIRTGAGRRINVEYISANPTGPLNVVSARAGAYGAALVHLLDAIGYDAHSEYYVNDSGRQVRLLGQSLRARYLQLQGEDVPFPADGYQGAYLETMAVELRGLDEAAIQAAASAFEDESFQRITAPEGNAEAWRTLPEEESVRCFAKYALMKILAWQRETCRRYGLRFDTWYFESELHETKRVERALEQLRKRGAVMSKEGAVWFKAKEYGDEEDRVLVRSDGTPTYFLADIAYHYHKYQRGFEHAIDFWGPDHHGHITRMQGAMRALGTPEGWLEIQILQQVNFLENGRPIDMSKRKGQFISMDALMDEVGPDVAKFIFLTRKPGSHLDFDLELAKQQSSENPVYYVQYAHARICAVLRKAAAAGIEIGEPERESLLSLREEPEWNLVRELVRLPQVILGAANAREPHRLSAYAHELAGLYHQFYHECVILSENAALTQARLHLCLLTRRVIGSVLDLIGISAPEIMGEKE